MPQNEEVCMSSSNGCSIGLLARDICNGLADLVFPPKCLICEDMPADYLCESCKSEIIRIDHRSCRRCGAPLQESECVECKGTEFAFESAICFGIYEGVLREAIHKLKYSRHRVLAPHLGRLLADHLAAYPKSMINIDAIIPVPLHSSRMRHRCFNQSALLAMSISERFAIPLLSTVVARIRPTPAQANLSYTVRKENLVGAFKVTRPEAISGRTLLLVDDVLTTGSTLDAVAHELRNAGAKGIHVLTLARSI